MAHCVVCEYSPEASAVDFCRHLCIKEAAWKRLDLVVALNPDPQHLPSIKMIVQGPQPKFLALLERVRQGQFKSSRRSSDSREGIRVCHPGLWRQL